MTDVPVEAAPFLRDAPLAHDLGRHFAALRAIRTRSELERSDLWKEIGARVTQLLASVERADHVAATGLKMSDRLRVVAWNVQRGASFEALARALATDPILSDADVLLLVEVDDGMGRSGNRHVARELALRLGMSYAFNPSYLALEDDFGENLDGTESTLALAGQAILSRVPFARVESIDLPELRDKFSSSEKRLGHKRALAAVLELPDGPLAVAAVHLDSNASPAGRARQLAAAVDAVEGLGCGRALLGGDFNTTTYDVSSTWALVKDLAHKLFVLGFKRTVDNYLTPMRRYETPVFELLARRGFAVDGFNQRPDGRGTMDYDFNGPYAIEKARSHIGWLGTKLLLWRLKPWGRVVAARLDWFAGKGVRARASCAVSVPASDGKPPSDHAPIAVDLALGDSTVSMNPTFLSSSRDQSNT